MSGVNYVDNALIELDNLFLPIIQKLAAEMKLLDPKNPKKEKKVKVKKYIGGIESFSGVEISKKEKIESDIAKLNTLIANLDMLKPKILAASDLNTLTKLLIQLKFKNEEVKQIAVLHRIKAAKKPNGFLLIQSKPKDRLEIEIGLLIQNKRNEYLESLEKSKSVLEIHKAQSSATGKSSLYGISSKKLLNARLDYEILKQHINNKEFNPAILQYADMIKKYEILKISPDGKFIEPWKNALLNNLVLSLIEQQLQIMQKQGKLKYDLNSAAKSKDIKKITGELGYTPESLQKLILTSRVEEKKRPRLH